MENGPSNQRKRRSNEVDRQSRGRGREGLGEIGIVAPFGWRDEGTVVARAREWHSRAIPRPERKSACAMTEACVNSGPSPSALREMRRHFSSPITLFVLGAVVAVLTLVGPFGTDESLTPGFRALYWLSIVAATYAAGFAVDAVLRPRLSRRRGGSSIPMASWGRDHRRRVRGEPTC
jgi:hypothetical protein